MAAAAADTITTHQALERGATEANPLIPENTYALVAIKTGAWFGLRSLELWVESKFEEAGQPMRWYHRLLIWLPSTVLWTWAAVHNHGVMR